MSNCSHAELLANEGAALLYHCNEDIQQTDMASLAAQGPQMPNHVSLYYRKHPYHGALRLRCWYSSRLISSFPHTNKKIPHCLFFFWLYASWGDLEMVWGRITDLSLKIKDLLLKEHGVNMIECWIFSHLSLRCWWYDGRHCPPGSLTWFVPSSLWNPSDGSWMIINIISCSVKPCVHQAHGRPN